MKINIKIHNRNHLIKNILGNIEFLFTKLGTKNNELTVLNYHGTQKKFITEFKKQIIFYKKIYNVISPNQLDDFYNGNLDSYNKPLLLITFDDGIKNNLYAVEILNEFNLKACFFIVPEFIDTPFANQKEYFSQNIRRNINYNIDSEIEDFTALSWDDIKVLINNGHKIGSHTQTHKLHTEKSDIISEFEIIQSKNNIIHNLGLSSGKIDSFCSIVDTLRSVSVDEFKLIRLNYKYHFTTLPGPNISKSNTFFIKRNNVEIYWLLGSVKYALGKWDLKRWEKKEAIIKQLI